jgi:exo-1,4-beta-D-glucosaminidase
MKHLVVCLLVLFLSAGVCAQHRSQHQTPAGSRISLDRNWLIQSSAKIQAGGAAISRRTFRTSGWYRTSIPSTVVAALVDNKVYDDPYFGMNLRKIPGCSYPVGVNFSNQPMPEDSPFRVSWWYRSEFRLSPATQGKNLRLHFDGINFRANIWLNGKLLGAKDDIAGTFRLFEFDVTRIARPGVNVLACEIFPPQPDDLALTWVDWNPAPPDKDMGIWRDVYISAGGPVILRFPQVVSRFDLPSLDVAHLTVNVELTNSSDREVRGTLRGRIENIHFEQTVRLGPRESQSVTFDPAAFGQLNFAHPRVWWPAHLGPQNLYTIDLEVADASGKVSDRQTAPFGIRQVTSSMDNDQHRVFQVNGRNVLIRGGGWSPDMLLRNDPRRIKAQLEYVKDMNLNTVRLEGKFESDYFYDLADRLGILLIEGWCCCDHWEHWIHHEDHRTGPLWHEEDYRVAARSLEDQIRRLRNHPSLLVWMNGSDNPPPPDVEKMYIDILQKKNWPNPYLSSATDKTTSLTGVTGVKMKGPYEWVPPCYWLQDKGLGGAHGFATEISPGPAVPPIESLRRMLPPEHLWPADEYWSYHAGGGEFKTLTVFDKAMESRYGKAKDLADYAKKSQLMTYEAERAMFEGYARNRYSSGGVIQWMLNNAWPSLIWHLFDYYLRPAGGYFGTRKACEPIHAQYSYDDHSVVVVNNTYQPISGLKLVARVYDVNLKERLSRTSDINAGADTNVRAFQIPEIADLTTTYFLKLTLTSDGGQQVSENFYWLSTKDDVLDPKASTWYYTPASSYADFTSLQDLPAVELKTTGLLSHRGANDLVHITIENPTKNLAMMVHLQIRRGRGGEEVLPVFWRDNYLTVMPGERVELTATYSRSDLGGVAPFLTVDGWNVSSRAIELK